MLPRYANLEIRDALSTCRPQSFPSRNRLYASGSTRDCPVKSAAALLPCCNLYMTANQSRSSSGCVFGKGAEGSHILEVMLFEAVFNRSTLAIFMWLGLVMTLDAQRFIGDQVWDLRCIHGYFRFIDTLRTHIISFQNHQQH